MISRALAVLDANDVGYALTGGMAVIARGHARFTLDFDILTTDRRVLQPEFWSSLRESGVAVDVRIGDHEDPLAGVVHIGAPPEEMDVVVGRWKWEQRVIERAERLDLQGLVIAVPLTSDLILLKLAAGGPIDRQDVIQLLAFGPREQLVDEVNEAVGDLQKDARDLWDAIVGETGEA